MSNKPIRGVAKHQEVNPELTVRDHRGTLTKFKDWLKLPDNMVALLMMHAMLAAMIPAVADILFVLALLFTAFALSLTEQAPLKIPKQEALPDANQPHPATGKPEIGEGIFFLGNEMRSGKEVWLTNSDCRQHFLVLGTTGAGKPLRKRAKVRTPKGWVRIGDLRVGDLVCTPDGRTALVDGVFPQGQLDICRVAMSDGRVIEACPGHLWRVIVAQPDGTTSRRVVETKEVSKLLRTGNRVAVEMCAPVEAEARDLPMNPYLLGRTLEDTPPADLSRILGRDQSVPALVRIPESYRNSAIAQRLEVIRGLLAKGGTADVRQGLMGFRTQHQGLASDFQEIIWSLGGWAKLKTHRNGAGESYSVAFRHPTPEIFFSDLYWPGKPDLFATSVVDVVTVEMNVLRDEAVCIHVDHPDHLFIADNYIPSHNTEALLGFAANALTWGSGFLFCDGKGDVALFAKVYAMARRFGREDDILVLNYMTGNRDVSAAGGDLMSNTLNPFSTGSSDSLTQMVVSLMEESGGDGAIWKGRAVAMMTGVMKALCWLRDQGMLELNVGTIRDYMSLKMIQDLAEPAQYPNLPPQIRHQIKKYLVSLPGYDETKGPKQGNTTLEQHGYLEMQFTKILGSLADVYGHIFSTPYGEVDMHDVVLNRRILVIMLPALEKAGDEIANLGKIVVATLKGMMGGTLGSKLQGNWADVVDNRPTNSPSPFLCILDEVGYYTVEGMALMAAQARSLGFSMIYASQDIPAMKRLNEKEAASIIANTNTKIFMRTEEAESTGALAVASGGKARVNMMSGYKGESGETGVAYKDNMESRIEERDRIDFTELKAQTEGEMTVLFQEKVVRLRGMYANPEGSLNRYKLKLSANHFIQCVRPTISELRSAQRTPEMMRKLLDPEFPKRMKAEAEQALSKVEEGAGLGDEIALVAQSLSMALKRKKPMIDGSCVATARVMQALNGVVEGFANEVKDIRTRGFSSIVGEPDDDEEEEMPGGLPTGRGGDESFRGDPRVRRPAPPVLPPRRGMPPSRVKPVPHKIDVEGREIPSMVNRLGTNDSLMKTLSVIDFNPEEVTKEAVSQAMDEAIGGETDVLEGNELQESVDNFERASGSAMQIARGDEATGEEDGETGGDKTGAPDGDQVGSFLEMLLKDTDGD